MKMVEIKTGQIYKNDLTGIYIRILSPCAKHEQTKYVVYNYIDVEKQTNADVLELIEDFTCHINKDGLLIKKWRLYNENI